MKKKLTYFLMTLLTIFASFSLIFTSKISYSKNTENYAISSQQAKVASIDYTNTYEGFVNLINAVGINNESPLFYLIKEINKELYPENPEVTLSKAIVDNTGTLTPKIVDQLFLYNNMHLEGWTLRLEGSNWNNLDLAFLDVFGVFSNIKIIEMEVTEGKIAQSMNPFNVATFKNIKLFERLSTIERLQFRFAKPINNLESISYQDLAFLELLKNSLTHLDISTLTDNQDVSVFIDTPIETEWFINMKSSFKLWVPYKTQIASDESNAYFVQTKTQADGKQFKEITKNASAPIPLPTNEDHNSIYIYVDGSKNKVDAIMYQNQWYWMLERTQILTEVICKEKNTRNYYTTLKVGDNYELLSRRKVTYPENMNKAFLEKQKIPLPTPEIALTTQNAKAVLNTTIYIDGKPFFYEIENSIAYLNYDVTKIYFANHSQNKFYTTISKVLLDIATDTISTTESSNYKYSEITKIDIPEPNNNADSINYNDKSVYTIVSKSVFYWDFLPLDFSKIAYYSPSLNHVFSDIEAVLASGNFPSDLTMANLPKSRPNLEDFLLDIGQISLQNYEELDSNILIDEKVVTPVLRNGYVYWDYLKIEDVKFLVKKEETNYYFTNFELANDFAGSIYLIDSIVPPIKRYIPPAEKIIKPSIVSKNDMRIDGSNVTKVLRNGKFYWNNKEFDISLKSIKYVNENGYYFTSLPLDMLDTTISEVDISIIEDEVDLPSKFIPFYQNNNLVTSDNFANFLNPLIIDDIFYDFKFLNSVPLLPEGANTTKIKYAVNYENPKTNKFLTKMNILNYSHTTESNDFEMSYYNEQTNFPVLKNPEAENDSKIFINNKGEKITISAILDDDGANLAWNNPIIDGANYLLVDSSGQEFYANTLNEKTMVGIAKISTLEKPEKLLFSKASLANLSRDYKDVALYLVISLIALVLFFGIINLIFILHKQRKGL